MPKKKTNEKFIKEVYELVGDEYVFLEEYQGADNKIWVRHNNEKCSNHEYLIKPDSFTGKKQYRCPECSKVRVAKSKIKTNDRFIEEYRSLVGEEYLFLEDYQGAKTKISIRHNVCRQEYEVTPDCFLGGSRCLYCVHERTRKRLTKSTKQFKSEVKELHGDEYTVIGEYEGGQTKIKMLHNQCGKEYETTPANILKGGRCLHCSYSKGEFRVAECLEAYKMSFETQYRIPECRYKRPLPFDFALFSDRGKIELIIEYDGIQHYIPQRFNGTTSEEKNFELQQHKDNIKNTYCKENNIPLLRIPYWDFDNIEEILEKELTKLGIIVI